MTENDFLNALREAYRRAGTQQRLADAVGVTQSTIAGYFSKRYSVGNMTVSTLLKLFPNMTVDFFGDSTGDDGVDRCRKMLLAVFDKLSPDDQLRCLSIVIANFPDQVKEGAEK